MSRSLSSSYATPFFYTRLQPLSRSGCNQPPELFFHSRFASLFLTRQGSCTVGIGGVPGSHRTIRSMYLSGECAKNHYATGG